MSAIGRGSILSSCVHDHDADEGHPQTLALAFKSPNYMHDLLGIAANDLVIQAEGMWVPTLWFHWRMGTEPFSFSTRMGPEGGCYNICTLFTITIYSYQTATLTNHGLGNFYEVVYPHKARDFGESWVPDAKSGSQPQ